MIAIIRGQYYSLTNYINGLLSGKEIVFYHEEVVNGEKKMFDGASEEDILKVLIDRMEYLAKRADCEVCKTVVGKLEECLILLLAHKALMEGSKYGGGIYKDTKK